MLAKEFDLPEEVFEILPSDPFEQLDVARKITSIALSTRISALESEADALRRQLLERDDIISDLHSQLDSLDSSLSNASDKLSRAEQEKESLVKENAALSNTVKKLNRDVAKLEAFRKTLMRSLNEEEDSPAGAPNLAKNGQSQSDEDASLPPPRAQSTESGHSYSEDAESETSRPRISPGLLLASQTSTPRLTPPGSPPSLSASVSPSRSPRPLSPRRHSISFSTTRARARVDGKEFFRQVRSRLSYEQFGAFLTNVKELNSHKQTKEDTLRKAAEIFGDENKDLYTIFEGLITRNAQ